MSVKKTIARLALAATTAFGATTAANAQQPSAKPELTADISASVVGHSSNCTTLKDGYSIRLVNHKGQQYSLLMSQHREGITQFTYCAYRGDLVQQFKNGQSTRQIAADDASKLYNTFNTGKPDYYITIQDGWLEFLDARGNRVHSVELGAGRGPAAAPAAPQSHRSVTITGNGALLNVDGMPYIISNRLRPGAVYLSTSIKPFIPLTPPHGACQQFNDRSCVQKWEMDCRRDIGMAGDGPCEDAIKAVLRGEFPRFSATYGLSRPR